VWTAFGIFMGTCANLVVMVRIHAIMSQTFVVTNLPTIERWCHCLAVATWIGIHPCDTSCHRHLLLPRVSQVANEEEEIRKSVQVIPEAP
jgi:hypothetical protein